MDETIEIQPPDSCTDEVGSYPGKGGCVYVLWLILGPKQT